MRWGLTEEELALLASSELVAEEGHELGLNEEHGDTVLVAFRERLLLGDLSW
jgi:hypothetical protein